MADQWPTEWTPEVHQALLSPFPPELVELRENKFHYIEARAVMSRLDEVVGPGNWSFEFELLHQQAEGVVAKGSLTVLGVTKQDAGEHWRAGDRDKVEVYKSAASDALKRCAAHFGVGRYLYHLETQRAGKITAAERDAAARKAGYINQPQAGDPEVEPFRCSDCGCDVEIESARWSQRRFGGRVFCPPCRKKLVDGIEERVAADPEGRGCSECGQVLTPHQNTVSRRVYG